MRSDWSRSPCIASASKPCFFSDLATTSTSTLRLQKMMPLVSASPSPSISARSTSRFSLSAVSLRRGVCLHHALVDRLGGRWPGGRPRRGPGCAGRSWVIRVISGAIVAEKNSVWRVNGTSLKMRSMSGMKPMSSMRSASSTTMICTPVSISLPRSKWSSRRPGRGDQHVDAAVDQLVLVLEADAADQERHGELHVLAEYFSNSRRPAPRARGSGASTRLRGIRARARPLESWRDHRQHEGGGLAGAGLGDAEHVAPFERVRDRLDLDRGWGCRSRIRIRLAGPAGPAKDRKMWSWSLCGC